MFLRLKKLSFDFSLFFYSLLLFYIPEGKAEFENLNQAHLEKVRNWANEMREIYGDSIKSNPKPEFFERLKAVLIDYLGISGSHTNTPPGFGLIHLGPQQLEVASRLAKVRRITPPCLLSACLEVNKNNRYKSLLTCHNLLKNLASLERKQRYSYQLRRKYPKYNFTSFENLQYSLVELRFPQTNYQEKFGPWYHGYAVALAAYVCGGPCSRWAVFNQWEMNRKWQKRYKDKEKYFFDILHHRVFSKFREKGEVNIKHVTMLNFEFSPELLCQAGQISKCCMLKNANTVKNIFGKISCKCKNGKKLKDPYLDECP